MKDVDGAMKTPLTSETLKTVGNVNLFYGAVCGTICESEDSAVILSLNDRMFRSKQKADEFGEFIVKAVNSHDKLVAALEGFVRYFEEETSFQITAHAAGYIEQAQEILKKAQ